MQVARVFKTLLLAAELWLAGPILYLFTLSALGLMAARKRRVERQRLPLSFDAPRINFAILIPAHNEELLIGHLLESLAMLVYPKERYTVYVVADNCTDQTAELARATSWAHVYERFDPIRRGKGYALNWLLQQLEADQLIYDAYIFFDADAIVEPTYLQAMARELERGTHALQGRSTVLNATASPSTALRLIAVTLVNDVRNLGRNALGGSCTLGNGMCLSRAILQRNPWQAYSLAEDYEYYLTLVQQGIQVRFVPEAIARTQMPATFAQMRTQDVRWETPPSGQSRWRMILHLLRDGLQLRDKVRLDAVAELLTPPLSFLGISCLLASVTALFLKSRLALLLSLLLGGGLLSYIGAGLYLLRPPRIVYKAFFYAPGYMLWKLWVYLVLRRSKKYTSEWIRTNRTSTKRGAA